MNIILVAAIAGNVVGWCAFFVAQTRFLQARAEYEKLKVAALALHDEAYQFALRQGLEALKRMERDRAAEAAAKGKTDA